MKKTVILALAAAILFSASAPAVFSPPGTSAEAMIVLHAGSGAVLAEKNADTPMLIASTTKLMTALTALDLASGMLVCGAERVEPEAPWAPYLQSAVVFGRCRLMEDAPPGPPAFRAA